jgi:hypothetical protein
MLYIPTSLLFLYSFDLESSRLGLKVLCAIGRHPANPFCANAGSIIPSGKTPQTEMASTATKYWGVAIHFSDCFILTVLSIQGNALANQNRRVASRYEIILSATYFPSRQLTFFACGSSAFQVTQQLAAPRHHRRRAVLSGLAQNFYDSGRILVSSTVKSASP